MAEITLFTHYFNQVEDPQNGSLTYDIDFTIYDDVKHVITVQRGGSTYPPFSPYPQDEETGTPGVLFDGCVPDEPGQPRNRKRRITYFGQGEYNVNDTAGAADCGGNPCPGDLALVALATASTDPINPNGTVTARATSSAGAGFIYTLYAQPGRVLLKSSGTGFFLGLPAAEYEVEAQDAAGCVEQTTVTVADGNVCAIATRVRSEGDLALIENLGPRPLEYDWLDNGKYSPLPWHGGYLPGVHFVRAREITNPGCTALVRLDITPDEPGICYRYALVVAGVYYPIDEPTGFDGLERQLKRDKNTHGVAATFNEVTLGFECSQGGDLLQAAYALAGVDTEASLVEFIKDSSTPKGYRTPYSGALVMVTYAVRGTTVFASVEADGLPVRLANRFKTVVDLYSQTSVDGAILPSLSPERALLHSRAIVKVGEARAPEGGGFNTYPFRRGDPGPRDPSIVLGFSNIVTNDLELFNSQSTGVSMSRAEYPVFEAKDILVNATLTLRLDFQLKIILNAGDFDTVKLEFTLKRTGQPDEQLFFNEDQGVNGDYNSENYQGVPGSTGKGVHLFRQYKGLSMAVGDTVTVAGKVEVSGVSGSYYWTYETSLEETSYLKIEAESLLIENEAPVMPIYEATERVLLATLGSSNLLRSNFFGRPNSLPTSYPTFGGGGRYVLATGFGIRGLSKPFPLSMETLWQGANPLFCLGIGVKDEAAGEVIRFELASDFYEDVQVLELGNPSSGWSRKAAPEYLYNRITLGFEKWKPEGRVENGLDEPVASRTWNTPIKHHDSEYKQLSKFLGSGYRLEAQRRVGLSADDGPDDDGTFIVAMSASGGPAYPVLQYQDITGSPTGARTYIYYESLAEFKAGEQLVITDGPNAGTYTVVFGGQFNPYATPPLSIAAVAEAVPSPNAGRMGSIEARPQYKSERAEAFDVVNNLYSPGTAYNLRLSAGRLIYGHQALLGASLWPRPIATTGYRVAAGEGNLNLETRLKASDRNRAGVPAGKLVVEKQDVAGPDLGGGTYGLFLPNIISIEHELTQEEFEYLTLRRYRWIATQLEPGKWYTGWIINASFKEGINGESMAKFDLIERNSQTPYDPDANAATIEYTDEEHNVTEYN